jgi:hypothetical protein
MTIGSGAASNLAHGRLAGLIVVIAAPGPLRVGGTRRRARRCSDCADLPQTAPSTP